jgi:hypothetical protein
MYRKGRDISDVGVEAAAIGEIKTGLVPDASYDIALDCPRFQRVSAVGTTVVYCVYRAVVVEHRDRVILAGDDHTTPPFQLVQRPNLEVSFSHGFS